jgi:DNA-binding transcriptional ArsR family regulator
MNIEDNNKLSIEDQAGLLSVLADPTRLKLLELLSQQRDHNALCVNALAFRLGVTQSAVSQHLKILKGAGLVKGEKRGYRVHYYIKQEALSKAKKSLSQTLEFGKSEIDK